MFWVHLLVYSIEDSTNSFLALSYLMQLMHMGDDGVLTHIYCDMLQYCDWVPDETPPDDKLLISGVLGPHTNKKELEFPSKLN